ncbi:MAG: hypothetical protein LBU83_00420 [Bacteroidales bacterium]|jgi:nitrate/nitrite transporter NarK|nr:hypothetical protein [Bacteroidales bacterium]
MRKLLLIFIAIIGTGISANAQDVILKKDASEIKAKVIEITDQQIKYQSNENYVLLYLYRFGNFIGSVVSFGNRIKMVFS